MKRLMKKGQIRNKKSPLRTTSPPVFSKRKKWGAQKIALFLLFFPFLHGLAQSSKVPPYPRLLSLLKLLALSD